MYLNGYFSDLPDDGNTGRGSGGRNSASGDAAGTSTSSNLHSRKYVPSGYKLNSDGVLVRSTSTPGFVIESTSGSGSKSG